MENQDIKTEYTREELYKYFLAQCGCNYIGHGGHHVISTDVLKRSLISLQDVMYNLTQFSVENYISARAMCCFFASTDLYYKGYFQAAVHELLDSIYDAGTRTMKPITKVEQLLYLSQIQLFVTGEITFDPRVQQLIKQCECEVSV